VRPPGPPTPLQPSDAQPAWEPRPLQPVARPLPRATELPATWSATTVEALRACPYRFFAQALLRLDEDEELEREPEKREFGNWLHATLKRYHDARRAAPAAPHDPQALHDAAEAVAAEMGMDAAAWLPFRAALEGFVRRYLAWQAGREANGWRYHTGEVDLRISPPQLGGIALRGRLDRIDQRTDGAWALLDYKTGSLTTLKKRAADPLEDTQLAIYAVLAADHEVAEAAYLALDERDTIATAPHKQVMRSAALLLDGLGADLQRLRAGEPMRALGQGDACEYCAARGLCRRDHWAAEPGEGT
jgi:ATP-dependent helicase/nuclease subunit B